MQESYLEPPHGEEIGHQTTLIYLDVSLEPESRIRDDFLPHLEKEY